MNYWKYYIRPMIVRLSMPFVKWVLKPSIQNLEHWIETCPDNADICRDGKSYAWWIGKGEGIKTALILLGLKKVKD